MREKKIEQRLMKVVRQSGGLCPKFVSPGTAGMPDRIVMLPGGQLSFVEVKAPGKKTRCLQEKRHKQLQELGFRVFVLDCMEQIPDILCQMGVNRNDAIEDDVCGCDG